MARLIGSFESNLDTDFALLFAGQEGFVDDADTMTIDVSSCCHVVWGARP